MVLEHLKKNWLRNCRQIQVLKLDSSKTVKNLYFGKLPPGMLTYYFFFFFFFAVLHGMGESQFPNQGSNLHPLHESYHWTTREGHLTNYKLKWQGTRTGCAGRIAFWKKLQVKTTANKTIGSQSHSFLVSQSCPLSLKEGSLQNSGYSKVIAQWQQLSALILQIIDESRVLSILLSKYFLQRSNRKCHG